MRFHSKTTRLSHNNRHWNQKLESSNDSSAHKQRLPTSSTMPQSRLHNHNIRKILTAAPCIATHSTKKKSSSRVNLHPAAFRRHTLQRPVTAAVPRGKGKKKQYSFRATRTRDTQE
jgi:hypothetical protein